MLAPNSLLSCNRESRCPRCLITTSVCLLLLDTHEQLLDKAPLLVGYGAADNTCMLQTGAGSSMSNVFEVTSLDGFVRMAHIFHLSLETHYVDDEIVLFTDSCPSFTDICPRRYLKDTSISSVDLSAPLF